MPPVVTGALARRLYLGAAAGLLVVVALCAGALNAYISSARWVDHTIEVRQESYEWLTAVLDAHSQARDYIATGSADLLARYETALAVARDKGPRMRNVAEDNPNQVRNVEATRIDAQAVLDDLQRLVSIARAGRRSEALAMLESDERSDRMNAFRADVQSIRVEEERLLGLRRERAQSWGLTTLFGAATPALVCGGLLMIAWRRERAHERSFSTLALEARGRLDDLSELAAALSAVRTVREVAEVVVVHGMRAAGADTCTLYQVDATGRGLDLIGDRGVAPAVLERLRRIDATTGNPATFATFESGTATWAESEADYAQTYPALAAMKAEGARARAFWSVPLVAEGEPVGLLGVGFFQPRTFSQDEKAFVETLTNHCAQALLRASRLEREDEARRWFTTTLRSIGDAVIATDAEGRVTFMNPVAESLTRWTEAEAKGRALDEVFCILSEQTRAAVESPVTKVLREGKVVGLANHTVLRARGGPETPIDDSGAPIRTEAGRIVGVVLVFRDATHEKRGRVRSEFLSKAGEALVASIDHEATLATVARLAVPTLADWCSVELVDPATKVSRQVAVAHVDENKVRFARELGERYPIDRDATRGVPQVIRSGRSELYAEISSAMLEQGAVDAEHLRVIRELQLRSAMIVPLRVRGHTFGAMTFVHAESDRRYSEDDLVFAEDFARRAAMAIENSLALKEMEEGRARERLLRGEAELANRAKDEFLATVSHELRTPLNAILGWTTILRRRNPSEDAERGLAIVERNARLQSKLIEDVLDTSRIISGKLSLNLGPADVTEAAAAAIETVMPAAEAKGIQISTDLPAEPLTITADADRLQQIVWNILSNSVKFTPKGGSIEVSVHPEGSEVCIRVRDTGEGIRREVLPVIFERFRQADASTTRRHGGLGLGLSIVKQLVAAHGGTVHAESGGDGQGATFTVRLPARTAVAAVRRAGQAADLHTVDPGGTLPRLDGLRVLVVDDEDDARGLVGEVLREQGAEVHLASSALEALESLAVLKLDVVVSDIGMPDTDGFALIRKIRSLPLDKGGRTPAVALTAYARVQDAQRAFSAGYQRHVAKPVEPLQLVTVVANLGGRSLDGA
ncbi:MAG TPA: ATP-binding protein [Polyangiaceae bacterium]|jgi:PAS domain S-box-containing protein